MNWCNGIGWKLRRKENEKEQNHVPFQWSSEHERCCCGRSLLIHYVVHIYSWSFEWLTWNFIALIFGWFQFLRNAFVCCCCCCFALWSFHSRHLPPLTCIHIDVDRLKRDEQRATSIPHTREILLKLAHLNTRCTQGIHLHFSHKSETNRVILGCWLHWKMDPTITQFIISFSFND